MTIESTGTVREVAFAMPGATRIFEKLGIDYCCGGAKPLADACAARGISTDEVMRRLKKEGEKIGSEAAATADFSGLPLMELITHITTKHHAFTKQELIRLDALINKVCSVHGRNHDELLRLPLRRCNQ